jgi:hypothetical protein
MANDGLLKAQVEAALERGGGLPSPGQIMVKRSRRFVLEGVSKVAFIGEADAPGPFEFALNSKAAEVQVVTRLRVGVVSATVLSVAAVCFDAAGVVVDVLVGYLRAPERDGDV